MRSRPGHTWAHRSVAGRLDSLTIQMAACSATEFAGTAEPNYRSYGSTGPGSPLLNRNGFPKDAGSDEDRTQSLIEWSGSIVCFLIAVSLASLSLRRAALLVC